MNREQNNMAIVALILAGFANAVMVANVNFDVFAAIGNGFIMVLAAWLMFKATKKTLDNQPDYRKWYENAGQQAQYKKYLADLKKTLDNQPE